MANNALSSILNKMTGGKPVDLSGVRQAAQQSARPVQQTAQSTNPMVSVLANMVSAPRQNMLNTAAQYKMNRQITPQLLYAKGEETHRQRAEQQSSLEKSAKDQREALWNYQTSMDWSNRDAVAEYERMRAEYEKTKADKKALDADIRRGIQWGDPGERDKKIAEYNRLNYEAEQWMLSGGTGDPAWAESGAKAQELLKEIQTRDELAGNGVRDYSPGDRLESIAEGTAKGIGEAVSNWAGNIAEHFAGASASDPLGGGALGVNMGKAVLQETDPEAFAAQRKEQQAQQEAAYQRMYATADRLGESASRDLTRAKEGLSAIERAGVDIAQNILEMAFDAGVSAITGGGSLASMFVRAGGSALGEARRAGANADRASLYAIGVGGIEVLTEKMFDGVAHLYGKGIVSENIIESVIRRMSHTQAGGTFLRMLLSGSGEAVEEAVSGIFGPALKTIYTGNSLKEEYSQAELEEVLYSMGIGFAIGFLGGGTTMINGENAKLNAQANSLTNAYAQLGENPTLRQELSDRALASPDAYIGAHDPDAERLRTIQNALLNPVSSRASRNSRSDRANATTTTSTVEEDNRTNLSPEERYVENVLADENMSDNEKATRILSSGYYAEAFENMSGVELDGTEVENKRAIREWLQNRAGAQEDSEGADVPPDSGNASTGESDELNSDSYVGRHASASESAAEGSDSYVGRHESRDVDQTFLYGEPEDYSTTKGYLYYQMKRGHGGRGEATQVGVNSLTGSSYPDSKPRSHMSTKDVTESRIRGSADYEAAQARREENAQRRAEFLENEANFYTGDRTIDALLYSAREQLAQDWKGTISAIAEGERGWDQVGSNPKESAQLRARVLNHLDASNVYYVRGNEVVREARSSSEAAAVDQYAEDKELGDIDRQVQEKQKADESRYERERYGAPPEGETGMQFSQKEKAELARYRAERKRAAQAERTGAAKLDTNKLIRNKFLGAPDTSKASLKFVRDILTDINSLADFVKGEGAYKSFPAAQRLDVLRAVFPNANWQFDGATNTISLSREPKGGDSYADRFEGDFVPADDTLPSSNQNDIFDYIQEAGLKVPTDGSILTRPRGFDDDQIANRRREEEVQRAGKAAANAGRKGKGGSVAQVLAGAAQQGAAKDSDGLLGQRGLVKLSNLGRRNAINAIEHYRKQGASIVERENFTEEEKRIEREAAKYGAYVTFMDASKAPSLSKIGAVTVRGSDPSLIFFRNSGCRIGMQTILRHEITHLRIRQKFRAGHGAALLAETFANSPAGIDVIRAVHKLYAERYGDPYTSKLTKGKYKTYAELEADTSEAASALREVVDKIVYEEAFCDLCAGNAELFASDPELADVFPELVDHAYAVAQKNGLFSNSDINALTNTEFDQTIISGEGNKRVTKKDARGMARAKYEEDLFRQQKLRNEKRGVTVVGREEDYRGKHQAAEPQSAAEYAAMQNEAGKDGRSNVDMAKQERATTEEEYRQQRYADTHGIDSSSGWSQQEKARKESQREAEETVEAAENHFAATQAYGEEVHRNIIKAANRVANMVFLPDPSGKPIRNRNARHMQPLIDAVVGLADGSLTLNDFIDTYHEFGEADNKDTVGYFYDPAVDARLRRLKEFPMDGEGQYSTEARSILKETMDMLEHRTQRLLNKRADASKAVTEIKSTNTGLDGKTPALFKGLMLKQLRPDTFFHAITGFVKNTSNIANQLAGKAEKSTQRKINISTAAENYFRGAMENVKAYRYFSTGKTKISTKIPGLDRSMSMNEALGLLRTLETDGAKEHIIKCAEREADDDGYGTVFSHSEKDLYGGNQENGFRNPLRASLLSDEAIKALQDAWGVDPKQRGRAIAHARAKARLELDALAKSLRAEVEADAVASKFDKAITRAMRMLGKEIDSTYSAMYGVNAAKQGKTYWPLSVASTENNSELMSDIRSGLKNAKFIQERVGPSGSLRIMTATDVMSHYIDAASDFAAFAELSDDLELMSKTYRGDTSFKAQIEKSFGRDAGKWLDRYVDVLNGKRGDSSRWAAKIRGNLAQSSLLLNGGVALKQSPSYFDMIGAGIDFDIAMQAWRPFRSAKSWSNNPLVNVIATRSSMLEARKRGYADVEIGEFTKGARDLSKKLVDRIPAALTNWITKTDFRTVSNVLLACKMQVEKNGGVEVGSAEYYDRIARLFEDVVLKTQPIYTAQFRAEYQRSDNEIIRSLSMFRSQQTQNLNQIINAVGEYSQIKKSGDAEAIKKAEQNMHRVFAGQITGSVLFGILSGVARGLLRKDDDFKDKDGNITAGAVLKRLGLNTVESMAGTVWFGDVAAKALVDVVSNAVTGGKGTKEFYSVNDNVISGFNDLIANLVKFASKPNAKSGWNIAFSLSQLTGLPIRNCYNMVNAVVKDFQSVDERFNFTVDDSSENAPAEPDKNAASTALANAATATKPSSTSPEKKEDTDLDKQIRIAKKEASEYETSRDNAAMDKILAAKLSDDDTDVYVEKYMSKPYREVYFNLRDAGFEPREIYSRYKDIDSENGGNGNISQKELLAYYKAHPESSALVAAIYNAKGYTKYPTWDEYIQHH